MIKIAENVTLHWDWDWDWAWPPSGLTLYLHLGKCARSPARYPDLR